MDEELPEHEPADPEEVAERNEQILSHWDQVVADMEATAAEYRDDDWDVAEIHPGDVTVIDPDTEIERWGFDVLVASNEFEAVERWVVEEDGDFDACEVFRAEAGGIVYAVVAMRDEAAERAVLFPIYYDPAEAEAMLQYAQDEGAMYTHLRDLQEDPVVTFSQSDPSLFTP